MRQDSTVFVVDSLLTDNLAPLQDSLSTMPDSLMTAIAEPPIVLSEESVYGAQSMLVAPTGKGQEPEPRNSTTGLFEGFLALGVIFFFLLFFRYARNFFSPLITGLFNYHASEKQFNENSLSVAITTRVLLFFSFISISFLCWLLWYHNSVPSNNTMPPWKSYVLITSGIFAYFLIKATVLKAIDFVAQSAPVMQLTLYFGRIYIIAAGFILFPVALLIAASDTGAVLNSLLKISIALAAICFGLYIFRIIQIFFSTRISIFFLILYLCTLEIIPFLVLYSFVSAS